MGSCFGCFFLFCFRSWGVGRGRDLDLSGRKPSLHQALVPSVYINCACGGLTKQLRCRTRDQEVAGLNPVYGGLSQCCPNTIWWEIIFSTPPSTCPPPPLPHPHLCLRVVGWVSSPLGEAKKPRLYMLPCMRMLETLWQFETKEKEESCPRNVP